MSWENWAPVVINITISIVTILVAYKISKHTIDANRKINEDNLKVNAENAGKNRIIYGVEQIETPSGAKMLKKKLATGNYTVLNSFSNPSCWSSVIVVLGKINP